MIDESKHLHITDFDRGSFRATDEEYREEKERLELFIQGEYVDEYEIIGADDLGRIP
jgi:hypothetical protein